MVALLLALLISASSCWLISRRLAVAAAPAKVPDLSYVVAARPIQPGDAVKAEDLQLVSWPGNRPIEGAQTRIATVAGREALFPLAQGEPILDRHLAAPGSGIGLASKIPEGMRAVTLRSDEVVGVAGFLIPGSHVDVLVTFHTVDTPEPLTATVLQNVVALAAGHEVQPDPIGKPSDVTVVTLLLSPEDAQRAVLASAQGQIHFVLRSGADQTTSSTTPVMLSQLAGRPTRAGHAIPRASQPAAPAQPVRHEIETVLAGQLQSAGIAR
jgi:pilus assembly protein CpaB